MYGQMLNGYGAYPGVASPNFGASVAQERNIEAQTEYSIMTYLKYLNLITARKLENAQNTHYQSRAVTSVLQGLVATNPMGSSLLYMLYFRDVLNTLMTSQSVQRHDIWTVWNFLEIMETNEDPEKTSAGDELRVSIDNAYATSMRIFATEAMYDFQILMIDYYLQPMLAQLAGVPAQAPIPAPQAPSSFVEEEATIGAQPEKPFFGAMMMGNPQYFTYYLYMLKFYAKYLLLTSTQSLATEAAHHVNPSGSIGSHLPALKQSGLAGLQQWVQIKFTLLYFDMYMIMSAPGLSALQSTDGPSHVAATNLVQTEEPEARVDNLVVEVPVPVAAPAPVEQAAKVQPRQSVVG